MIIPDSLRQLACPAGSARVRCARVPSCPPREEQGPEHQLWHPREEQNPEHRQVQDEEHVASFPSSLIKIFLSQKPFQVLLKPMALSKLLRSPQGNR